MTFNGIYATAHRGLLSAAINCAFQMQLWWVVTIRSMQAVEMSFLQRVFGLLPIDTVRSWVFIAEPPLFQFEGS